MKKILFVLGLLFGIQHMASAQNLFTDMGMVGPTVPSGNMGVGINIMNPQAELHVIGTEVRFEENNFSSGFHASPAFPASTFCGIIGLNNMMQGSNNCVSFGEDNIQEAVLNSTALGFDNLMNASSSSMTLGSENVVIGAINSSSFGYDNSTTEDTNTLVNGASNQTFVNTSSLISGIDNLTEVNQATIITGMENHVVYNFNSGVFGAYHEVFENTNSFSLGAGNQVVGSTESLALGEQDTIIAGHASVSIGGHNSQHGHYTFTMGNRLNIPGGDNLILMGKNETYGGSDAFYLGFGNGPTIFSNADDVGIGTVNPQSKFDVEGTIRSADLVTGGNVSADANGNLILSTGPTNYFCSDLDSLGNINFCGGASILTCPGELMIDSPLGIGIKPSAVGTIGGVGAHLAVNGYGWFNGFWLTSDERYKTDVEPVKNAVNMIKEINGYTYQYNTEEYPEMNFQKDHTYGFIAQELKGIVPELVEENAEGYLAVNYVGMIPILTQAVKEQQDIIQNQNYSIKALHQQINSLKDAIQSICNGGCDNFTNEDGGSTLQSTSPLEGVELYQNKPNPTHDRTSIGYYLPNEIETASLLIFDLQGKQMARFDITERGQGQIEMTKAALASGMYLYGLMVDGELTQTLKMVIMD